MRLRWSLSKWKDQAPALQERKLARDLAPSQDEASPVLEQKPRDREGWMCLWEPGCSCSSWRLLVPPSSIFSLKTGCKASVSPVGHGSVDLEPAGTESQICIHHVECALLYTTSNYLDFKSHDFAGSFKDC